MELKKLLTEEQEKMINYKKIVTERLENAPEGRLKINSKKKTPRYYHFMDGKTRYLPEGEIDLARQLAQKSYDMKILRCTEKRLKQINRMLRDYEDDELEQIYQDEMFARRELVKPVEMTFEQQLEQWKNKPYISKGFNGEGSGIITNSGLQVRSKSEKILADYFDSREIVYKYECPLKLKPFGAVYPDFTFLSPKTGEEIYWEHEGMMDDSNYATSAVKKMNLYAKNGIFIGKNLILTFETSTSVLDMKIVATLVEKYLIKN